MEILLNKPLLLYAVKMIVLIIIINYYYYYDYDYVSLI